ncbi:hypothetical protein EEL32_12095 [Brevibacillus laterosporus]|nr:hypothetical protein [Brevibacillus laterosporus]TPG86847.1 hypothetical protein EEL32_12095 [Brevibacillus laterosporus]
MNIQFPELDETVSKFLEDNKRCSSKILSDKTHLSTNIPYREVCIATSSIMDIFRQGYDLDFKKYTELERMWISIQHAKDFLNHYEGKGE